MCIYKEYVLLHSSMLHSV